MACANEGTGSEGILAAGAGGALTGVGGASSGGGGGANATTGGTLTAAGGTSHVGASGGVPATGGAATGGVTTRGAGGSTTGGVPTAAGGATTGGVATSGVGGVTTAGSGTGLGGTTPIGGSGGIPASGGRGGAATGGGASGGAATGGSGGANGYPLGNPPVPSAGCGKIPTLTSGTHKMKSAGLDREYILSLPEKYDSKAPHRVVFGMHWMNGSDEAVQGWSKWFGLKTLDTENATIFVAPQGYTDASPWRGDNKDHIYFDDLLAALAADLCVDTSRVFSVGFSFGAMYTNALAQNHQGTLRGVVVYETADYNIYFPANTGKPLAYMGVHGIKDKTCPIDAGRRSRDRFVKNNGCTVPSTVPEAKAGGSYVTYDYKCPSNYPVRWITFDGAHTYPPNDTGTWVYGKTWEFISQF